MTLISLSADQIIREIRGQKIKREEIRKALLMRALDVAVENNYIAEICAFKEPTGDADEFSLNGVCISVADWIDMEGYDSTCGLTCRAMKPVAKDAVIVKVLRDHLGVTPLYRSSVNQASGSVDMEAFTNETMNKIWGRAKNPHNKEYTTGGACGGDAGLVAS